MWLDEENFVEKRKCICYNFREFLIEFSILRKGDVIIMANKYAGTKTEKNLWEAFAGESQARNKYSYFASVAKKNGYEQISSSS